MHNAVPLRHIQTYTCTTDTLSHTQKYIHTHTHTHIRVHSNWVAKYICAMPYPFAFDLVARLHSTLQHAATHCNKLQHAATRYNIHCNTPIDLVARLISHCDTLQHIAIHCNTLQHTRHIHYKTLLNLITRLHSALQYTATHCNTLQHTATHCNTLQYTATYIAIHCLTSLLEFIAHCNIL